ncbi:MAG: hypothetical protein WC860_02405 [Candidatus Margulisiibacteriota bacterium]|jgi:hypothetical protein
MLIFGGAIIGIEVGVFSGFAFDGGGVPTADLADSVAFTFGFLK